MSNKFHDSPTGTLEKHSLADLHHGDIATPLTALGHQEVRVTHSMGSDQHAPKPSVQKGGSREPKGMGRSVAKSMMSAAKHKAKY